MHKSSVTPFLLGVSGGPCSGKTEFPTLLSHLICIGKSTVCQKIVDALQPKNGNDQQSNRVAVIPMENFYKPKTIEQREKALRGNYNLDHPSAFDEKLLLKTLEDLLQGRTVKVTSN